MNTVLLKPSFGNSIYSFEKNPYVLLEPEEAVLLNDYMKLFINNQIKNHHFQPRSAM